MIGYHLEIIINTDGGLNEMGYDWANRACGSSNGLGVCQRA